MTTTVLDCDAVAQLMIDKLRLQDGWLFSGALDQRRFSPQMYPELVRQLAAVLPTDECCLDELIGQINITFEELQLIRAAEYRLLQVEVRIPMLLESGHSRSQEWAVYGMVALVLRRLKAEAG